MYSNTGKLNHSALLKAAVSGGSEQITARGTPGGLTQFLRRSDSATQSRAATRRIVQSGTRSSVRRLPGTSQAR